MMSKTEIAKLIETMPESACQHCRHALLIEQNKSWECRAHAPVVQPLIQATPQGPKLVGTISVFPAATQRCGEFDQKFHTVS